VVALPGMAAQINDVDADEVLRVHCPWEVMAAIDKRAKRKSSLFVIA